MVDVAFLSGHGYKGGASPDAGACGPAVCEVDFTANLALQCAAECRSMLGMDAHALTLGAYADRTRAAEDAGASLLVHLHGDVGTAAVYHFPGSPAGQAAAVAIGAAVGLPVREASPSGYPRAWGLLRSSRTPAVLVEAVDLRAVDGLGWVAGMAVKMAIGVRDAVAAIGAPPQT